MNHTVSQSFGFSRSLLKKSCKKSLVTFSSATKLVAFRTHWFWEAFYEAPWNSLPWKWRKRKADAWKRIFFLWANIWQGWALCQHWRIFIDIKKRCVFLFVFHKIAGLGLRLVYNFHSSCFFSHFLYPYFVGIFFVESESFISCWIIMSFWMFPERLDLMGFWENTCHSNFLIRHTVVEDRLRTVFHQGNIYS